MTLAALLLAGDVLRYEPRPCEDFMHMVELVESTPPAKRHQALVNWMARTAGSAAHRHVVIEAYDWVVFEARTADDAARRCST